MWNGHVLQSNFFHCMRTVVCIISDVIDMHIGGGACTQFRHCRITNERWYASYTHWRTTFYNQSSQSKKKPLSLRHRPRTEHARFRVDQIDLPTAVNLVKERLACTISGRSNRPADSRETRRRTTEPARFREDPIDQPTAVKLVKERRSLQDFGWIQSAVVTARRRTAKTVKKNLSTSEDLVEELRRLENSEIEPAGRRETSSKEETRNKVGWNY